MPKLESFAKDTSRDDDMNLLGAFMKNRQHLPEGIEKLQKLIEHQFKLPESADSYEWEIYSDAFVYFTQVCNSE